MRTAKPANKSRRSQIDVLRVKFWYRGIASKLKCKSAYAVEQRLEPHGFKKHENRIVHTNKWRRYALGESTPQQRFVMRAERQVPGSCSELNHPLWAVLRKRPASRLTAVKRMRDLPGALQRCVLQAASDKANARWELIPFNQVQGRKLLQLCSLDGLAALSIYWADACRRQSKSEAEQIGHLIYSMLLILGRKSETRDLIEELFELFRSEIFIGTPWSEGDFSTDKVAFRDSVNWLHRFGLALQIRQEKHLIWQSYVSSLLWLLSCYSGMAMRMAMRPSFLLRWQHGPPSYKEWAANSNAHIWREWGWSHLRRHSLGHGDLPVLHNAGSET